MWFQDFLLVLPQKTGLHLSSKQTAFMRETLNWLYLNTLSIIHLRQNDFFEKWISLYLVVDESRRCVANERIYVLRGLCTTFCPNQRRMFSFFFFAHV